MDSKKEIQHVYLVGAKSLGAYGGYETFVYKLTEYHQNKENIKYHVACKANGDGCMDESKFEGVTKINDHEFEFHNAHCFKIDVPQIGSAQAIYYDVAALKACCEHIKKNHIPHPIVYIMACRIGPFAGHFYREIHKLGGTVFLNPDGHEWMRAKWSAPIRKYWKISEQMMVKYCDLAICDSFGYLFSGSFGAAFNILLNFILIPVIGVYGAALATCISYIAVFMFRVFHTRKYIKYDIMYKEFILGSLLMLVSAILMFVDGMKGFLLQLVILLIGFTVFSKTWIPMLQFFLNKIQRKRVS